MADDDGKIKGMGARIEPYPEGLGEFIDWEPGPEVFFDLLSVHPSIVEVFCYYGGVDGAVSDIHVSHDGVNPLGVQRAVVCAWRKAHAGKPCPRIIMRKVKR